MPEKPFATPADGRAFALAVVAVERLGVSWDVFRAELAHAIARTPDQPYYASWLDALERLAADRGDVRVGAAQDPRR